ncbi:hypothetical protein MTO96_044496 [Rhipicephalus appendiculatus]
MVAKGRIGRNASRDHGSILTLFQKLAQAVPNADRCKKPTELEILQDVINYIFDLEMVLNDIRRQGHRPHDCADGGSRTETSFARVLVRLRDWSLSLATFLGLSYHPTPLILKHPRGAFHGLQSRAPPGLHSFPHNHRQPSPRDPREKLANTADTVYTATRRNASSFAQATDGVKKEEVYQQSVAAGQQISLPTDRLGHCLILPSGLDLVTYDPIQDVVRPTHTSFMDVRRRVSVECAPPFIGVITCRSRMRLAWARGGRSHSAGRT